MFSIDMMSRIPIYEQIIEQVENFILKDILSESDKMPSVRKLSVDLSVNPNTIQKAYSELDSKGIIISAPGRGCFISQNAKEIISSNKRKKITEFETLVRELKVAGVSEKDLTETIANIFKGGEA